MKDNTAVELTKFQLKMLRTLADKYDKLLIIYAVALGVSILIGIVSFIYYSRQKEPVLRKYPVITLLIGSVLFALPIFLYFNQFDLVKKGLSVGTIYPLVILFSIYFFPIFIALEQFILWKRGSYKDNIKPNSLILGIRKGDFGEPVINPSFVRFTSKSLFGDLHIVGGKGSGKTTTFVFPPLQQILSDTTESRSSVFMVDAKGVLADSIEAMAHPRKKDIMIIGYEGIAGNLLDMSDPLLTANNLNLAFSNFKSGNVNEFFQNYQETFLRNTLQFLDIFSKRDRDNDLIDNDSEFLYLLEPFFKFETVTLVEVYNWVTEFYLKQNIIKYVKETIIIDGYYDSRILDLVRYFEKTLRDDEGHLSGLIDMLSPLISEKVRKYFCSTETFDFVDAINKGKVIIVNVPEGGFGTIAKLIGLVLLLQMQKTALKRNDASFKMNRSRFIYIILDEVQKFMCDELANFPSVSRSAKVCNIYLHQSLGQIPEQYMDDFFGNTLNKFSLYVRDNRTAEYLSQNFGEQTVRKETESENKQGGMARQGELFTGNIRSIGKSYREEKERRFSAHDILHMPKNTAVVSKFDGGQILESFRIDLMPFYLGDNDLYPIYHFIFMINSDMKLDSRTVKKLKTILRNTGKDVDAEFKRFDNSDEAFYFMFAFKNPTRKAKVETIFKGIDKGLSSMKLSPVKKEFFQGDLDTVVEKKAEYGF